MSNLYTHTHMFEEKREERGQATEEMKVRNNSSPYRFYHHSQEK